MPRFRIERTGALDLEFEGVMLADVSSREGEARRWTEIRIYRADSGKYVTEMVGCTEVRGEKERRDVKVLEAPEEIPEALIRQPRGYLTKTALDALDDAADLDPAIRPVVTERI